MVWDGSCLVEAGLDGVGFAEESVDVVGVGFVACGGAEVADLVVAFVWVGFVVDGVDEDCITDVVVAGLEVEAGSDCPTAPVREVPPPAAADGGPEVEAQPASRALAAPTANIDMDLRMVAPEE